MRWRTSSDQLQPPVSDPAYDNHAFWTHYADSSAIQPIILKVNAARSWVRRFKPRPAYLAAIERGRAYALAE